MADEAVPPLESELAAGTMVGEYRIEGKIGEGGFGAVYKAVHPVIGKAAAIKVLGWDFSSNPEMVSRFVAEARAVNQIHHKNIIDVFAFGRMPDGRQYYVMELLSGQSLDEHRKEKGCLSIEEAMPILRGVVRALGAAHAGGIAHRDLKPENVFLLFDEDGGVMPKLIDFGIAKLLGDEGAAGHKTRTGTPMGTPYYMSPEQCRGKNVDHRTDIYSLGVLIHVLLTGKKPFDGESVMDILLKHLTDAPPRLSATLPHVPKALDDALGALLEKDPGKRPQTAADALNTLEAAVQGLPPEVLKARGGADPGRVSIVSGVGPHKSSAEGAEAQTIVDPVRSDMGPPNATLEPAARDTSVPLATGSGAAPRRRLWIPAVAFAAAGAGAAAALLLMASKPAAGGAEAHFPASGAEVASGKAQGPVVVPAGDVKSSAPGTAKTGQVLISLDTDPKVVDVYRGADKIGTSEKPIPLARGKDGATLTLKAQGYLTRQVDVRTDGEDATIPVKLEPDPAKPGGDAAKPAGGAGAAGGAGSAAGSKPVGAAAAGTGATKTSGTTTTKPAPHKGDANDLAY